MMRGAIVLGVLLLAGPTLAADKAAVPAELQAAWARNGNCNRTNARLEISAFRAGAIHYDAVRRALVWDVESRTDYFALGPRGLQLFHVKADGERERLVKCPGKLIGRRR